MLVLVIFNKIIVSKYLKIGVTYATAANITIMSHRSLLMTCISIGVYRVLLFFRKVLFSLPIRSVWYFALGTYVPNAV